MNAAVQPIPVAIARPIAGSPIFVLTAPTAIAVRASSLIAGVTFDADTPVDLPEMTPGTDYAVEIADGRPVARPCGDGLPADAVGGFHCAPGGNATARAGGDSVPAINPCSIWDAGFRPACPDPRGMALVEHGGLRFWCDIYLLGAAHASDGTSRFGVEIADGRSLPKLDFKTAKALIETHGKQLLGAEEFFAAAYGVTERSSADRDPKVTGLDAARTSRSGVMQATGNLWVWGTDGHPDDPRPSVFGGSWVDGDDSGSRCAVLGYWPDVSAGDISARGRSDHLNPA